MLLSLSVVITLKLISYCHVLDNVKHVLEKLKKIKQKNLVDDIPENEISPEVIFI